MGSQDEMMVKDEVEIPIGISLEGMGQNSSTATSKSEECSTGGRDGNGEGAKNVL